MDFNQCLSLSVYRNLTSCSTFSATQWDEFIRQARRANVLSRLAILLQATSTWADIPDFAKRHLQSAIISAMALRRTVMWEIYQINKALYLSDIPSVFLKGAAYHIANLPVGEGRLYNDIDFMVPKKNIEEVEQILNLHGWKSSHNSDYDETYYRTWMHEIPPLRHVSRGSVIDLHHAILPKTAALKPDSELLIQQRQSIQLDQGSYCVLSPIDMVLHSATHLFHEGELDKGLRDLMDLDLLLKHFGKESDFWGAIVPRAERLQLTLPLFYTVRYCKTLLHTPVPKKVQAALQELHGGRWINRLMDGLFHRALLPEHKSCQQKLTSIARYLLFIRGHYLRMPMRLLIPHLFRKAFIEK